MLLLPGKSAHFLFGSTSEVMKGMRCLLFFGLRVRCCGRDGFVLSRCLGDIIRKGGCF